MNRIFKYMFLIILISCIGTINNPNSAKAVDRDTENKDISAEKDYMSTDKYEKAYFAGGCFWCMQPPFDKLEGVVETWVGYSGGTEKNPTYKQVASGQTGHAESIEVLFDPEIISYKKLLDTFWMNIDPTQENGQFADHGKQYRTVIFYVNDQQKEAAEASKKRLDDSGKFKDPIVTDIEKFKSFYKAEEYHQKYYKKNPIHYNLYKKGSGREGYINRTWK